MTSDTGVPEPLARNRSVWDTTPTMRSPFITGAPVTWRSDNVCAASATLAVCSTMQTTSVMADATGPSFSLASLIGIVLNVSRAMHGRKADLLWGGLYIERRLSRRVGLLGGRRGRIFLL